MVTMNNYTSISIHLLSYYSFSENCWLVRVTKCRNHAGWQTCTVSTQTLIVIPRLCHHLHHYKDEGSAFGKLH